MLAICACERPHENVWDLSVCIHGAVPYQFLNKMCSLSLAMTSLKQLKIVRIGSGSIIGLKRNIQCPEALAAESLHKQGGF